MYKSIANESLELEWNNNSDGIKQTSNPRKMFPNCLRINQFINKSIDRSANQLINNRTAIEYICLTLTNQNVSNKHHSPFYRMSKYSQYYNV